MFEKLPYKVNIVEVGPRDGLQNESFVVPTKDKIQYIEKLMSAGIKSIEATSFVKTDKIPQMSDGEEVFKELLKNPNYQKVSLSCLVPNLKGLERAIQSKVSEIAVFTATSETFNKKNINATIEESLKRVEDVCKEANKHQIKIRGYISTVFGCPYEGETSVPKLIEITKKLFEYGAYEVSLGDTIGVANPFQVKNILLELKKHIPFEKLSMHFHDTRGMALANILTSLELGISTFDSSSGGLGGCPYAQGATGNVATEDLVYMFHSMGIKTGIDLKLLSEASSFILNILGKTTPSKFLTAYYKTGK